MKIQPANETHVSACDQIAREWESALKGCLGWVRKDSMRNAIAADMMNIALDTEGSALGFVIWSTPTRGVNKGWHVIHSLAVDVVYAGEGVGTALVQSVPRPIRLKCPLKVRVGKVERENSANEFYAKVGFTLAGTDETKAGRLLNVWELSSR